MGSFLDDISMSFPVVRFLPLIALLVVGNGVVYAQAQPADQVVVELSVPYVSQVPDGEWVKPWDQACEEASIAMVEGFFAKTPPLSLDASKQKMQAMIDWEDQAWKKNEDTDADETLALIEAMSSFEAQVKRNPSLEDIQEELRAGRPVIFFVNMYQLYQETDKGDSFHVGVITGFDEDKKEFIVNDPARAAKRYPYEVMMQALHDYNPDSKEADGTPTVLFTSAEATTSVTRNWFIAFLNWIKGLFR